MMWCCIPPPDVNLLVVLPLARPTVEQANELVKAARLEAAFRVEDLLNRAQDPHLANTQGKTPLCQAAQIGAARADPGKTSVGALPPIILATCLGDVQTTRSLLDCKADIDQDSAFCWRDVRMRRSAVEKCCGGVHVMELAAPGTPCLLSHAQHGNSSEHALLSDF